MKPTTRRVINGAGVFTDQFQPRRGDGSLLERVRSEDMPEGTESARGGASSPYDSVGSGRYFSCPAFELGL